MPREADSAAFFRTPPFDMYSHFVLEVRTGTTALQDPLDCCLNTIPIIVIKTLQGNAKVLGN